MLSQLGREVSPPELSSHLRQLTSQLSLLKFQPHASMRQAKGQRARNKNQGLAQPVAAEDQEKENLQTQWQESTELLVP